LDQESGLSTKFGGQLGEGPGIYKNIVFMPLSSLYPKVSGVGKKILKPEIFSLDRCKGLHIIIFEYYGRQL
jgi:hypothetical protein